MASNSLQAQSFIPGQRWVSNTESELGLGIVVSVDNRRVEISFPAVAERRTYAQRNAPLSRVRFEIGESITTMAEQQLTVTDLVEHNGCIVYQAQDEQQDAVVVPELELSCFVRFNKPQDRLFAGQIDRNRAFALRWQTLQQLRRQQQSAVTGLLGPRVQLLPHQLYIASEVGSRYAPRVLLADEVGLGKTIEAGMILHQQLLSGSAHRALIIVPDSLVHQWLVEMLRRFNLTFTILDEPRCESLEESGTENPFDSAQLILCCLPWLSASPQRQQQAVAAGWDMLIVDEAHHLTWSESAVSSAYSCVEGLAAVARGVLLLTATPEQLGVASHFARLRLLDPDRYHDLDSFLQEESAYQALNPLIDQLLAEDAAERLRSEPALLAQLTDYLGADTVAEFSVQLAGEQNSDAIIERLIQMLLDHHGTGRVLFRNTRSSVAGFPQRQMHAYPLSAPAAYSDALAKSEAVEQWLAPETLLGDEWINLDPRVEWLVAFLKQHRDEKILLICARAETALVLEQHLNLRQGFNSAVFHEGLSLVQRDRAAAYFADSDEGAQLLVCSEIGSEGRNFQFARHLVLFDLPLNPDLLEQRIGRLDRIGQRYTVELHVPYYDATAQQVLVDWYHRGVNVFERNCPPAAAIMEEHFAALLQCMQDAGQSPALDSLIAETAAQTQRTMLALQQGRDRLLELNSFNAERADDVIEAMLEQEQRLELSNYMEQVFDQYGVDQEHHSAVSVVLRPGEHMVDHQFPGLPDDGITVTFQREMALSREDIQFLTWEHPMVLGAMDMVLGGEIGNTAFCSLKLPPVPPGTVLIEAVYVLQAAGPADMQLQRYLPITPIRVVLASNGSDLSELLTPRHVEKLRQKVPRQKAQELTRHLRPQVLELIQKSELAAAKKQTPLIDESVTLMQQQLQSEIQRLQQLALVNPNIRGEEIAHLQDQMVQLDRYLRAATLRFDALRVVVIRD